MSSAEEPVAPAAEPEADADAEAAAVVRTDTDTDTDTGTDADTSTVTGTGEGAAPAPTAEGGDGDGHDGVEAPKAPRRHPRAQLTTTTARPEGGGRAAPGDAPAPARQWPLLLVLGLAGLGLLIVGTDLFAQAFRVGTLLVGVALLVGAVLRRTLPSVGMLAVRSRFTDMITYGVMGGLIVLLALMVAPDPWLRIPFLEDVLHLTVT
ncbi:DUF3017 domain-containing protein [Streptomyces sp. NPDC090025]|uniref:DUF3017 domain-containing protein n=1 Tax=Streptomyces sp. NPDC090025 TaxID=3365922 RepID=UPI003834DBC4